MQIGNPETLVKSAMTKADSIMRGHGEISAVIHVFAGDTMFSVPLMYDEWDKAETLQMVAAFLGAVDAEAYMLVAEGWFCPPEGPQPSRHPERKEGITCALVRRSGDATIAVADILRNPDGSYAGIGEVEITEPSGPGAMSSLFDLSAAQAMSRADKRRMRREFMRFAIPVEQPRKTEMPMRPENQSPLPGEVGRGPRGDF